MIDRRIANRVAPAVRARIRQVRRREIDVLVPERKTSASQAANILMLRVRQTYSNAVLEHGCRRRSLMRAQRRMPAQRHERVALLGGDVSECRLVPEKLPPTDPRQMHSE